MPRMSPWPSAGPNATTPRAASLGSGRLGRWLVGVFFKGFYSIIEVFGYFLKGFKGFFSGFSCLGYFFMGFIVFFSGFSCLGYFFKGFIVFFSGFSCLGWFFMGCELWVSFFVQGLGFFAGFAFFGWFFGHFGSYYNQALGNICKNMFYLTKRPFRERQCPRLRHNQRKTAF